MKLHSLRRFTIAVAVGLVLSGSALGNMSVPAEALSPSAVSINPNDINSVKAAYKNFYVPAMAVPAGVTTRYTNPCSSSAVPQASKDAVLTMINYYRALAGLPKLTENASATAQAQQAALILYANRSTANFNPHSPAKSSICYTAIGAASSAGSNLGYYYSSASPKGTNPALMVKGYMDDNGVPSLGHRAWVLFPPQTQVGLGIAQFSSALQWATSASISKLVSNPKGSWSIMMSTAKRSTAGTAWPSKGFFPWQNVPNTNWWSYSSPALNKITAKPTVTVTLNGGKTNLAKAATVQGSSKTSVVNPDPRIVWTMPTISCPTGNKVDVYHVTLKVGSVTATYDVKVFDASRP